MAKTRPSVAWQGSMGISVWLKRNFSPPRFFLCFSPVANVDRRQQNTSSQVSQYGVTCRGHLLMVYIRLSRMYELRLFTASKQGTT